MLKVRIKALFKEQEGKYGYRRITMILNRRFNYHINSKWSPVNKIDNLNRDFLPMLRLSFELEFGTHLQTALVI